MHGQVGKMNRLSQAVFLAVIIMHCVNAKSVVLLAVYLEPNCENAPAALELVLNDCALFAWSDKSTEISVRSVELTQLTCADDISRIRVHGYESIDCTGDSNVWLSYDAPGGGFDPDACLIVDASTAGTNNPLGVIKVSSFSCNSDPSPAST